MIIYFPLILSQFIVKLISFGFGEHEKPNIRPKPNILKQPSIRFALGRYRDFPITSAYSE